MKLYGAPRETAKRYSPAECLGLRLFPATGTPDAAHLSPSYVERHNLTMRMCLRRFTRLTNAFSKKIENHIHMLSLSFLHYNFCRIHKTLRMTSAIAAGTAGTLHDMDWTVGLIEARPPKPSPRGPYKKQRSN